MESVEGLSHRLNKWRVVAYCSSSRPSHWEEQSTALSCTLTMHGVVSHTVSVR